MPNAVAQAGTDTKCDLVYCLDPGVALGWLRGDTLARIVTHHHCHPEEEKTASFWIFFKSVLNPPPPGLDTR